MDIATSATHLVLLKNAVAGATGLGLKAAGESSVRTADRRRLSPSPRSANSRKNCEKKTMQEQIEGDGHFEDSGVGNGRQKESRARSAGAAWRWIGFGYIGDFLVKRSHTLAVIHSTTESERVRKRVVEGESCRTDFELGAHRPFVIRPIRLNTRSSTIMCLL